MEVEIIFHSSSEPAIFEVDYCYVKQECLALQFSDGIIRKFPLINIFSWSHKHGYHMGTRRE